MKKFILFSCIVLIFTSCGKKEETRLEAYNAEAFAFSVDGGWEVNAAVQVKGFQQNVNNKTYSSKLSYSIGIITPANDTIMKIASDQLNESRGEEFSDLPVEVQLELDSTYSAGVYRLIFNVKDELSGNTAVTQKEVELD